MAINVGQIVARLVADTKNWSGNLEKARKDLAKVEGTGKTTSRRLGGSFKALGLTIAGVTATVGAMTVAFKQLIGRGGQVLNVQRSFARAVGDSTAGLIGLRKASRGLIGNYDTIVGFNRALALGSARNTEEFAQLSKTAIALGRALGVDAKFALESLNLGIGRQSRLILDNLGIIVKAENAYKDYARAIGVAVSALTEEQKREAFRSAALEAAGRTVQRLGGIELNAADSTTQLGVAFGNLRDSIAAVVATSSGIQRWASAAADAINAVADGINALIVGIKAAAQVTIGIPLVAGREQPTAPAPPDVMPEGLTGSIRAFNREVQQIAIGAPTVEPLSLEFDDLNAHLDQSIARMGRFAQSMWEVFAPENITRTAAPLRQATEGVSEEFEMLQRDLAQLGTDIGRNFIFGLIDGISSVEDIFKQVLKGLISIMLSQFTSGLKLFSPSKTMAALGADTMRGYVGGLASQAPNVAGASSMVASAALMGAASPGATFNFSVPASRTYMDQARDAQWLRLLSESNKELTSAGFRFNVK